MHARTSEGWRGAWGVHRVRSFSGRHRRRGLHGNYHPDFLCPGAVSLPSSLSPSSSVGSNEVFDENPTAALCRVPSSFPLGPESLHHAACACDQKLGSPRSNCGRQRITSRIVTSVMMTMKISGQELPSHHVSILPAFAASSVHHSTRGTLSMRRGATLFDLLHLL